MDRPLPARLENWARNAAAVVSGGKPGGRKPVPLQDIRQLHLVLSLKCNQRCRMCYQTDYSRELDPSVVYHKLLPVYPHLEEIILQGGEPTVIPQTREFAEFVLRINPRVRFSVMTNGILFDEEWTGFFIRHGKLVNFSLNAASSGIYEAVSRTGNWPRIVENLNRLVLERHKAGAGVEIAASFVILQENIQEIGAFIEFGRGLGVDRVRFFYDPGLLPKDPEAVKKALEEASVLKKQAQTFRVDGLEGFEARFFHRRTEGPECSSPFNTLFVDVSGKVSFCCQMTCFVGDLRFEPVEKIWNNALAGKIREDFRNRDYRHCGYYCRPRD